MNKAEAILAVLILVFAPVSSCFANGVPTTIISLNPPTQTVQKCTNFTISIDIADVQKLVYWNVSISFNPALVEVLKITEGPFLKSFRPTYFTSRINNTIGYIIVRGYLCNATIGVSGSGTLAYVKFHCKGVGDTDLELYNTILKNNNWCLITHTTIDAIVHQIESPPPPVQPPCAYMGTLINNNSTWVFKEPVDGTCENFNVTVYIANVTDMYGYEFTLTWNSNYFNLVSWTVATDIWSSQAIIFNGTTAVGQYKQVVTALPPSTGVNGDYPLADLVFHIQNDACPNVPAVSGAFDLVDTKVSNSCSGIIPLCNPVIATWTFEPVQPDIWIIPVDEVNSEVGDTFTSSVLLKNAVRMKDFIVKIEWNQYLHTAVDCNLTGLWSTLLTTNTQSVVLNTDLFNLTTATITVAGPACGWYNCTNVPGYVYVKANTTGVPPMLLNLTYPSETIWLFNVTFTKCDPWYCGAQPRYTARAEHDWILENASTPIYFKQATISSSCGNVNPDTTGALYTFAPIPGDLDGSGHVDIADLMIEASYYGTPVSCNPADKPTGSPSNAFTYFYDLNHDGYIDIYDVVIVAKNLCRTMP